MNDLMKNLQKHLETRQKNYEEIDKLNQKLSQINSKINKKDVYEKINKYCTTIIKNRIGKSDIERLRDKDGNRFVIRNGNIEICQKKHHYGLYVSFLNDGDNFSNHEPYKKRNEYALNWLKFVVGEDMFLALLEIDEIMQKRFIFVDDKNKYIMEKDIYVNDVVIEYREEMRIIDGNVNDIDFDYMTASYKVDNTNIKLSYIIGNDELFSNIKNYLLHKIEQIQKNAKLRDDIYVDIRNTFAKYDLDKYIIIEEL